MNYFLSTQVKVFPCAYRSCEGVYEARANTERNLVNNYARLGRSTDSYVIDLKKETDGTDGYTLSFLLGGYYFEISDLKIADIKDNYLCIATVDTDDAYKTPVLKNLNNTAATGPVNLDVKDTGLNASVFYGLGYIKNIGSFTGIYFKPIIAEGESGWKINPDALTIYSTLQPGAGSHSIRMLNEGSETTATAGAVINACNAAGDFSTALGKDTIASGKGTLAAGYYNEDIAGPLFMLGNGTSSTERSNAFSVDTSGNTEVAGTLNVSNDTTIGGKVKVDKTLEVDGAVTLADTLNVTKDLNVTKNLSVTENATVSGTLTVTGTVTCNDTLNVTKNTFVGGTFTANDKATLGSGLDITGNLAIANIANFTDSDINLSKETTITGIADFKTNSIKLQQPTTITNIANFQSDSIELQKPTTITGNATNGLTVNVLNDTTPETVLNVTNETVTISKVPLKVGESTLTDSTLVITNVVNATADNFDVQATTLTAKAITATSLNATSINTEKLTYTGDELAVTNLSASSSIDAAVLNIINTLDTADKTKYFSATTSAVTAATPMTLNNILTIQTPGTSVSASPTVHAKIASDGAKFEKVICGELAVAINPLNDNDTDQCSLNILDTGAAFKYHGNEIIQYTSNTNSDSTSLAFTAGNAKVIGNSILLGKMVSPEDDSDTLTFTENVLISNEAITAREAKLTVGSLETSGDVTLTASKFAIMNANNTTAVAEISKDGDIKAQSFDTYSDKRKKCDIADYQVGGSILDLQVKSFKYIDDSEQRLHIGCIAQDLQEICPEIVHTDSEGYLTIEENKIVYLLLEEVKTLKKEIEQLKKEH